ncbi:MAG: phosphatidate cytidylyltransferase [Candidatus Merdivicinus sp.]
MKQRIITALFGLVILFIVLFFYETLVFNAAISVIAALAVFEILHSTGFVKNKVILICAILYGAAIPFYDKLQNSRTFFYVTIAYLVILIATLLADHQKTQFSEITTAAFISLSVPLAFSILLYIRDHVGHGLFLTLLACVAAWISDSAAYFVGRKFGKHKLCPLISPHKTVEGAIGGIVFAILFFVLFCWGYSLFLAEQGIIVQVSYHWAILIGGVCSVVGICGDLTASVIKRQTGIKDFGTIMPGHGGIMDRFDSFLFVVPTLYLLMKLFPILTILQ